MNPNTNIDQKELITSFDEYIRKYFPNRAQLPTAFRENDPSEIGMQMAKESLQKVSENLETTK